MPTFGTTTNPAHFVEVADPLIPGQVKRPAAGQVLKARTYPDAVDLADITTVDYGYWSATFSADAITVSGDGGVTWVGPLFSAESMTDATTAGVDASTALSQSTVALATAQEALVASQNGPATTWDAVAGKPTTFPPDAHSHSPGQIVTSLTVHNLLTATDQQTARQALGAGTGNGTSNLTLGATGTTAAPGNHSHAATGITFSPASGITATTVQGAIVQASAMGGGGGGGTAVDVVYTSGAYPTQAATPPSGVTVRHFYGPTPYVGATWAGVVDTFQRVDIP